MVAPLHKLQRLNSSFTDKRRLLTVCALAAVRDREKLACIDSMRICAFIKPEHFQRRVSVFFACLANTATLSNITKADVLFI